MKHTQEFEVPAQKETRTVRVTCDFCNAEIKREYGNAEEIEVKHRTGSSYPEGGSGEETSVDMCGICFDTKLVPWLRSRGIQPITKKWDW